MLDKEVFIQGIKKLVTVYPSWQIKTEDKGVMLTWYSFFEHNTERQFNCMISEYIQEEKAIPTVSGLLDHGTPKSKYADLSKYEV